MVIIVKDVKKQKDCYQGAAMAWVDLVAGVAAQVDLHPNPLLLLQVVHIYQFGVKSFDLGLK